MPQIIHAIRFLPFFFALALLPPEEQIRQRIVPHDQEKAGEKRGELYCVGHGLTIVQQHSPRICERSVVMIANIGIRLSAEEKESIAAIAKWTDTTISQIMRRLIRAFITTQGEENTAAQKENDDERK